MRRLPLLALLAALAAPAAAQDATPDTTDPSSYYPLAVGNRWEYGPPPDYRGGTPSTHYRITVIGDTLIGGAEWFVQREQTFAFDGAHRRERWERLSDRRALIRFDSDLGGVVRDGGDGAAPVYPCSFDVPFPPPDEPGVCGDGVAYTKRRAERPDYAIYQYEGVLLTFGTGGVLAEGVGPGRHPGAPDDTLAFVKAGDNVRDWPFDGMPYLPDPTPPASYYPLGVGDQWVYFEESSLAHRYTRRTVVQDSTFGGRTYAVMEWAVYDLRSEAPAWELTSTELLRFDPETTHVVMLAEDGSEQIVFCALGADFLDPIECGDGYVEEYIDVGDRHVVIGGERYEVPSIKYVNSLADPGPPGLAAGIGQLESNGSFFCCDTQRFEYARVGGVEYGTNPVSGEVDPDPGALALSLGPNPTAGPLAVALELTAPAEVTAEAFDALGRRVWRWEGALGGGRQRLGLDAAAWAPGLYVVRVVAGGRTASARFVRR